MTEEKAKPHYCSFCGKYQQEVDKLIAGPAVFICNECVDLCHSIVYSVEDEAEPDATVNKRLEQFERIQGQLDIMNNSLGQIVIDVAALLREDKL